MYSVIRCNQPNRSTLFPYTTLFRSDRMVFLDRLDFTAFIIFHRITQRLFEFLKEFEKALGDPVKDDEGREVKAIKEDHPVRSEERRVGKECRSVWLVASYNRIHLIMCSAYLCPTNS